MKHLRLEDLPAGADASKFEGDEHGAEVSFFLTSVGPDPLRQISIHPVARMETEWLE